MVQKGEVYYIVDQDYNNVTKNYATTKDAKGRTIKDYTIRGERPWVIIGINDKTVTVLPLTRTKPIGLTHKVYNLRSNKTSYVLFQPKTVNIAELGDFEFKLKPTVVQNIITKLVENFNLNTNTTRKRTQYSKPHKDKSFTSLFDYIENSSLAQYFDDDDNLFNW